MPAAQGSTDGRRTKHAMINRIVGLCAALSDDEVRLVLDLAERLDEIDRARLTERARYVLSAVEAVREVTGGGR